MSYRTNTHIYPTSHRGSSFKLLFKKIMEYDLRRQSSILLFDSAKGLVECPTTEFMFVSIYQQMVYSRATPRKMACKTTMITIKAERAVRWLSPGKL